MAHAAVKVDRVACLQQHGGVQLGVEQHRAFEHDRELFATVTQQLAKLLQRTRLGLAEDGHHLLVEQLRGRVDMTVVGRVDDTAFAAAGDAAPSGEPAYR